MLDSEVCRMCIHGPCKLSDLTYDSCTNPNKVIDLTVADDSDQELPE